MAFSVNSNSGAAAVYNALAKTQASTQKAQLQLATGKKVNSAADDTSGWNIGKQLEAASLKMKSQLSNIGSAKNFLSTAESALQQVYDKLNQIQSKQSDGLDPLKDATSLKNDIKTLADEIDSIFQNTKIGSNVLLGSVANSFGAGATAVEVNVGVKLGASTTGVETTNLGQLTSITTNLTATTNTTALQTAVRDAITYIGNKSQVLTSREDFLTASIANNDSAIAQIFDTDTLTDQMKASQGAVGSQLATAMMSQMNAAPQQILQLFR
ncbi:flagellar biosynthesis protein FliC [bacterium]|nr:flagellar biosynthesis protein FliC [bacterium]